MIAVNPVSKLHRYPLPKMDDLFATLAEEKVFTKIDLTQAYQQLKLDLQPQKYLLINTHKGNTQDYLLECPLPPKTMESLLHGIPGVIVYVDDILISRATGTKHLESLEVLKQLAAAGLQAKKHKCKFTAEFLEHLVDDKGIHPLPKKVVQFNKRHNLTKFKSYLGLMSYYGKFFQTCRRNLLHSTSCRTRRSPGTCHLNKRWHFRSPRKC